MNATPAQHQQSRAALIPQRLRAALGARDLSVAAAARILGWTQSNFQRPVKGQVKLSVEQLEWIEERLGVSMEFLLGFRNDDPGTNFYRARTEPSLRAVADPAEVVFYDGSGEPKSAASRESFLRESNSRPFHYKAESSSTNRVGKVIPFRARSTGQVTSCDKNAQIVPFPAVDSL